MNNRGVITAPIPTQKESPTYSAPDVIELVISEVDRHTAEIFCNNNNCLIATALMNRGYNCVSVTKDYARIGGWSSEEMYYFDEIMGPLEVASNPIGEKPFYGPEVVGKVIRLRKILPDEGKKAK